MNRDRAGRRRTPQRVGADGDADMTDSEDDIDEALVKLLPLYRDAQAMLRRLQDRVSADLVGEGHPDIVWLHKQVLSVERRAQEREANK